MAIKNYPSGTIVSFASTHPDSLPGGWLLCDGSEVSRGTYGNLFTVIGETYGAGDGSTTFNVPNLQEWFIKSVSSSTMSAGAGTTVGATTSLQGAQYSYNFGITIGQAQYQDSVGGSSVSSTLGPSTSTSTSSGEHTHTYQVSTDTVPWGRGVREGSDNMIPPNEYATQGKIYYYNDDGSGSGSSGLFDSDWFLYHHSGNQASSWQQHSLHSHSHADRAGVWTHHCSDLAGRNTQGDGQSCQTGVPICTTQQLFIGQSSTGTGKVPFSSTLNAQHKHLLGPEYQIEEGPNVQQQGEFTYQVAYTSKRLFSTRSNHNHSGVGIDNQTGITHGAVEHSFTDTITASFGVSSGYPGAGTQNSSGDLKPAAVVVGYIIKT